MFGVLIHLLMFVICGVGIALALLHLQKAPRAMLALAIGLGVLLVFDLASPLAETLIYRTLATQPQGGQIVSNLLGLWNSVRGIATAAAVAALVFAALDGRGIPLDATALSGSAGKR
jgi:hypothetical protein